VALGPGRRQRAQLAARARAPRYSEAEYPDRIDAFQGIVHPDDWAGFRTALRAHLDRREPFSVEVRLRARDGTWRWFWDRGQAEWDADGRPVHMAGSLSDVTERKRAEAALAAREAQLRTLVEHLPAGAVFLFDEAQRYQVAAGEALRQSGFDPEAIVGRTPREVLPPEAAGAVAPFYEAALAGRPLQGDVRTGARVFDTRAAPVRDAAGRLVAGMLLSVDVTAQRAAADRLRLFEAAVAHLNDLVVITEAEPADEPGPRIVFVNAAFERRTGYAARGGHRPQPRLRQGAGDHPGGGPNRVARRWSRAAPRAASSCSTTRRPASLTGSRWTPLRSPTAAGRVTHFVSVQRDWTARRADEEAAAHGSSATRRSLCESSADCVMLLARDGGVPDVHPGGVRVARP
jgi:PAS domain S-box-containing protein